MFEAVDTGGDGELDREGDMVFELDISFVDAGFEVVEIYTAFGIGGLLDE